MWCHRSIIFVSVIILYFSTCSDILADWDVTNLHPSGAVESRAWDVSESRVVGEVVMSKEEWCAFLWQNSSGASTNLQPSGALCSSARSVNRDIQGGWADFGQGSHASLWNSTADSWTDLNPTGASSSHILAVFGNQQGGYAKFGEFDHAGYWTGTANTWTDLHPVEATESWISDLSNNLQVGNVLFERDHNYIYHASVWSGSADTWVDLHPTVAKSSHILSTNGEYHVGSVDFSDDEHIVHASLWTGIDGTWTDLHSVSMGRTSVALGAYLDYQVGHYGEGNACFWRGTAESMFNLHALLPQGMYTHSSATGVFVTNDDVWISGYAVRDYRYAEAVLWHYSTVPEPPAVLILTVGFLMLLIGHHLTLYSKTSKSRCVTKNN